MNIQFLKTLPITDKTSDQLINCCSMDEPKILDKYNYI